MVGGVRQERGGWGINRNEGIRNQRLDQVRDDERGNKESEIWSSRRREIAAANRGEL